MTNEDLQGVIDGPGTLRVELHEESAASAVSGSMQAAAVGSWARSANIAAGQRTVFVYAAGAADWQKQDGVDAAQALRLIAAGATEH